MQNNTRILSLSYKCMFVDDLTHFVSWISFFWIKPCLNEIKTALLILGNMDTQNLTDNLPKRAPYERDWLEASRWHWCDYSWHRAGGSAPSWRNSWSPLVRGLEPEVTGGGGAIRKGGRIHPGGQDWSWLDWHESVVRQSSWGSLARRLLSPIPLTVLWTLSPMINSFMPEFSL